MVERCVSRWILTWIRKDSNFRQDPGPDPGKCSQLYASFSFPQPRSLALKGIMDILVVKNITDITDTATITV
jgi:hypothetical protein